MLYGPEARAHAFWTREHTNTHTHKHPHQHARARAMRTDACEAGSDLDHEAVEHKPTRRREVGLYQRVVDVVEVVVDDVALRSLA